MALLLPRCLPRLPIGARVADILLAVTRRDPLVFCKDCTMVWTATSRPSPHQYPGQQSGTDKFWLAAAQLGQRQQLFHHAGSSTRSANASGRAKTVRWPNTQQATCSTRMTHPARLMVCSRVWLILRTAALWRRSRACFACSGGKRNARTRTGMICPLNSH